VPEVQREKALKEEAGAVMGRGSVSSLVPHAFAEKAREEIASPLLLFSPSDIFAKVRLHLLRSQGCGLRFERPLPQVLLQDQWPIPAH
jgi:hypothetical protein